MLSPNAQVVPISAARMGPSTDNETQPVEQMLDVELGVGNVIPGGSWQDWSGGANPRGTFTVGRDPTAPSIASLVQMIRRDGQARALMNLMTLPIRAALKNSQWNAPEGEDPEADEVRFANDMWSLPPNAGGMKVPRSKVLRQTLLGLAHGFSAFEHVRHVPEDGPMKGKVTLRKLAYRDPRTVYFLADENGNFEGIRQIATFADRTVNVVIPRDKAWYFAANEEENPFYGISYFEPAFEHYQIKRKLYFISHLAAQFAAVPGRLGQLPQATTKGQLEKFRRALQNFAFDTSMLVPYGYKVEPFNNSTQFDFLKYIDHHNTMMAASVLAKFLQQEDRQVLIDNGKADASADMFVQMLQAIMDEIAESWSTHLMPQYIDFNFSSGIYPTFKFAPLTDDQKSLLISVFQSVVVATTLNCTPEFVRETEKKLAAEFDFDINYEDIEKKEKAAAELQAKQQAEQAALPPAPPAGGGGPPQGPPTAPGPQSPAPAGPPALPVPAGTIAASNVIHDDLDAIIDGLLELTAAADDEEPTGLPEDPDVPMPPNDAL